MGDDFAKTTRFLETMTRRYYRRRSPHVPSDFMLREFAAQTWRSRGYIRHMAFQSIDEIRKFLQSKAPRHFYYSSARYSQPEADEMDLKGWRSSDLVFDIDADHLPECSDKVIEIEVKEFKEKVALVDDWCIERAALRALFLKDILVYELGVDEKSIAIEFSGNRGFHVTAYLADSDEYAKSGSDVRREIVNYIKAVDLQADSLEPWKRLTVRGGKPAPVYPSPLSGGIRGRLVRTMIRLAQVKGMKDLSSSMLVSRPFIVPQAEEVKMLENEARDLLSVEIDEQVSIDISRLIRAPWSLNGKTMLPVIPVKEQDLIGFKISASISPFEGEEPVRIRLLADIPPAIRILGSKIRLRRNDRPRLEAPLALYLLSRGLAILS